MVTAVSPFASADSPVILDGGLGTTLETLGVDVSGPAWSATALHSAPHTIRDAHSLFFRAGADVAITASYQVTFDGPAAAHAEPDDVLTALRLSTTLAREAAEIAEAADARRRYVVASIGPYGASLADGSEYTGDYDLGMRELREWHRRRFEAIVHTAPDALAIETIPSIAEVEALLPLIEESGLPAWVTLTASEGRTRRGEPLAEALSLAAASPAVFAVGVNCCAAAEVAHLTTRTDAALIAYPNGPGVWDADARLWRDTQTPLWTAADAEAWTQRGVRFIGGCCRVRPADIRTVADAVRTQ